MGLWRDDPAEYQRQYRARRRVLVEAGAVKVPHGTRNAYDNYGCRCPACSAANHDKRSKGKRAN